MLIALEYLETIRIKSQSGSETLPYPEESGLSHLPLQHSNISQVDIKSITTLVRYIL